MSATVRHDAAQSRYEYVDDGVVLGVADYRMVDGVAVMHHTYTEPARRGEGIAASLVGGALDDLRAQGARVDPTCWYVAQFIDGHPEHRDLLVER
jgi:predicted GNAT family acetyltransferase